MNGKRVARKVLVYVATLFLLVSLNFIIFRVLTPYEGSTDRVIGPGPPWDNLREWLIRRYGLQQPLHIRYARYITNVFTLNFGPSFITMRSVAADLWIPLQNTLLLLVPTLIFIVLIGIPAQIYSLTRRGSSLKMKFLTVGSSIFMWAIPAKNRLVDAHLEDYIFFRRAMGFDERTTLYKLVFANTVPLFLMVMAYTLPYLIVGTMLAEKLFSLRGIGEWYALSLMAQDLPVKDALLFVYEILVVSAGCLMSLASSSKD